MKNLIWTLIVQGLGIFPAFAIGQPNIVGKWQYDGFLYEGHRYPNPNPELELTFTFDKSGQDRLFWKRRNEDGFCERFATYQLVENHLYQKVTWVNPKNAVECAKDSDMRLGQETEIEISFDESELSFHFNLNGKTFLYILRRI